jgi:hypothetical protein
MLGSARGSSFDHSALTGAPVRGDRKHSRRTACGVDTVEMGETELSAGPRSGPAPLLLASTSSTRPRCTSLLDVRELVLPREGEGAGDEVVLHGEL